MGEPANSPVPDEDLSDRARVSFGLGDGETGSAKMSGLGHVWTALAPLGRDSAHP